MSLDLNKLANKLDEALSNETTETLTKFLTDKRMSNNKQSSSIEWIIKQLIFKTEFENLPNQYVLMSDKDIDSIIEQAKAMHKEEVLSFNTLLYKHEIEALNNNTILLTKEEFYNETFGGKLWTKK